MTLRAYSTPDIDRWESQLLNSAAELRKIRQILQENEMTSVELEATRASEMIEKIETWAIGVLSKARQDAAREAAKKTREKILARKSAKSKN